MKQKIKTFFSGFFMGCAEIVPGVSGSTIALMLGIYDDFVNLLFSVSEIFKTILQLPSKKKSFKDVIALIKSFNYSFALLLGLGMFAAIALLSNLIIALLNTYPNYVSAALLGLVFSVIVLPLKVIRKPNIKQILVAVVSFVFFFILLGLSPSEKSSITATPSYWYLFFGGFAGITAMMLPGISGSFVLLILGQYYYIVGSISNIVKLQGDITQFIGLGIFVLGMVTGISTIARLLKNALEKHLHIFLAFVTGLLLASSRVLWPFVKTVEENGKQITKAVSLDNFQTGEIILTISLFAITLGFFAYINWKHAKI
jgi:putative membrane protein